MRSFQNHLERAVLKNSGVPAVIPEACSSALLSERFTRSVIKHRACINGVVTFMWHVNVVVTCYVFLLRMGVLPDSLAVPFAPFSVQRESPQRLYIM